MFSNAEILDMVSKYCSEMTVSTVNQVAMRLTPVLNMEIERKLEERVKRDFGGQHDLKRSFSRMNQQITRNPYTDSNDQLEPIRRGTMKKKPKNQKKARPAYLWYNGKGKWRPAHVERGIVSRLNVPFPHNWKTATDLYVAAETCEELIAMCEQLPPTIYRLTLVLLDEPLSRSVELELVRLCGMVDGSPLYVGNDKNTPQRWAELINEKAAPGRRNALYFSPDKRLDPPPRSPARRTPSPPPEVVYTTKNKPKTKPNPMKSHPDAFPIVRTGPKLASAPSEVILEAAKRLTENNQAPPQKPIEDTYEPIITEDPCSPELKKIVIGTSSDEEESEPEDN